MQFDQDHRLARMRFELSTAVDDDLCTINIALAPQKGRHLPETSGLLRLLERRSASFHAPNMALP
jgi:hypothetical protein